MYNLATMQSTKKSRKFSILAAVLILLTGILIGGYLVLKSDRGSASQLSDILNGATLNLGACEPDASDSNKDSDGDGLKDWQEMQIYKTEACKPDTDGDGYLDGEEIAAGYDPTKKAPGDEMPGTTHSAQRPTPIDFKTANLTELLSKKLSEKVTDGSAGGFDPQDIMNDPSVLDSNPAFANILLEMIPGFVRQFFMPAIPDEEIVIAQKDDLKTQANYLNKIYLILSDQNTLETIEGITKEKALQDFTETGDTANLDKFLAIDKDIYLEIKKTPVPKTWLDTHKEHLSLITTEVNIFEALKAKETDPLKALLAAQWLPALQQAQIDFITHMFAKNSLTK